MGGEIAIFAVDPGVTSGVAWGAFRRRKSTPLTLKTGRAVGSAQIKGEDALDSATQIVDAYFAFSAELDDVAVIHLVIEDFILRPQRAIQGREMLSPVEITGLVRGILWGLLRDSGPVVTLQMPAEAKSFASNDRLKRWGLPKEIRGRHAKDAYRHIAVYLAKQSAVKSKRKAKG